MIESEFLILSISLTKTAVSSPDLFLKKISDSSNKTFPISPLTAVKSQTDFQNLVGSSTDHFQILLKSLF